MANWKSLLQGLLYCAIAMVARSEPEPQTEVENGEQPDVTVTETEIKLPGVTIDRKTLEVRIEATACLESGILEFVVCKPGTFEHESIFTTEAKPELVHAALLLCGLKPTPQLAGLTDLWWDKAMKQEASRVRIEVEWDEGGNKKRVNLASMLRNREETESGGEAVTQVQDTWVFAGSFLQAHPETGNRFYAANLSGILVGIWPDPSTVIQYGIASGNPYDGKNSGMEINENHVPKLGTKVNLVFSRLIPLQINPPAHGKDDPIPGI